jgi:ketosteroid isomerase-like protein
VTAELSTTDFGVVNDMFAAIERGDIDTVRRCMAPDALTWRNHNEAEDDVDAVVALLAHLCANSTRRAYEDRRMTTVGSPAFLQHTVTATFRSGQLLRLPVMMRVQVNSDGLVQRIEEYVDWRTLEPFFEEGSGSD